MMIEEILFFVFGFLGGHVVSQLLSIKYRFFVLTHSFFFSYIKTKFLSYKLFFLKSFKWSTILHTLHHIFRTVMAALCSCFNPLFCFGAINVNSLLSSSSVHKSHFNPPPILPTTIFDNNITISTEPKQQHKVNSTTNTRSLLKRPSQHLLPDTKENKKENDSNLTSCRKGDSDQYFDLV